MQSFALSMIVLVLAAALLGLAVFFAGCVQGFNVGQRNRGASGRFVPEAQWEREFGETCRRRADWCFYLGLALLLVWVLLQALS